MTQLLENWRWLMRTANVAHLRATDALAWRNFALGGLTAFLGAVVGVGVFASLQGSHVPLGIRIAAGGVTLAAAGLASLRVYLDYGKRSEQHKDASRAYGILVREIDFTLQLGLNPVPEAMMTQIRGKMDQVEVTAPNVAPAIWVWAVEGVTKEQAGEAKDASTIDRGLWSRLGRLGKRLLK